MTDDIGQVLVTGATGFIGFEVAKQLSAGGHRPRLLVRRPLRAAVLRSLDAELVQGDLKSPASLARAVEGVDTVIHLGARAIFEEYSLVQPTIVDGSVDLMKVCAAAGVKRFIFSSSLLVYRSQDEIVDQQTRADTRLGYGRAKLEAEAALSALAEEVGIAFASIRLPHVYGARDLMFEQVRSGRVLFPGDGKNRFGHLHIADAARVMIAAGAQGWAGISPVADDEPADWNDFFAEINKYYPRFRSIGMPMWVALLGTMALTPFRRLDRQPSLLTPDAVRGWNLNLVIKKRLLWDELGIEPRYPSIFQGIPAVLDDCLEFQWIHPVADRLG